MLTGSTFTTKDKEGPSNGQYLLIFGDFYTQDECWEDSNKYTENLVQDLEMKEKGFKSFMSSCYDHIPFFKVNVWFS